MTAFISQFKNGDIFPWERGFTRDVARVAIPVAIQSLFMALLRIVDNLMIGQLGEIELAAVTQANRVTFLFNLTVFGLSGATAAYVAQFWGKRDVRGIRSVMGLALCLSVLAALLFLIPCTFFPQRIMGLLLHDAAALEAAMRYLPVIAFGYLMTAVSQCFSTVLKSTGQAKLPMAASITALLTNTFLNYCLIFGNFGFPRLGVRGGAIATVIATAVELTLVVAGGYIGKFATAARLSELVPRSLAVAKRYLAVAAPVILNEGLWALGIVLYSAVYGRMGTGAVAAVSIFDSVQEISLSTLRGMTQACAVLVGMRIGAGDERGAYRAAKRFLYVAIPSGAFAGLVLLFVSMPIASLFSMSDKVLRDARTIICIAACFAWINQLVTVLVVGIMRAGGDVKASLYLDVGATWLIGVPVVALGGLALGLEIPYVYLLAQFESIAKAALGLVRFRSRKWIHNLVK